MDISSEYHENIMKKSSEYHGNIMDISWDIMKHDIYIYCIYKNNIMGLVFLHGSMDRFFAENSSVRQQSHGEEMTVIGGYSA